MPAKRKPATERQNNRPDREHSVHLVAVPMGLEANDLTPPPLPALHFGSVNTAAQKKAVASITAQVEQWWQAFWLFERQASVLTPAHHVVLERWAQAYALYLRWMRMLADMPMVKGSTGQLRVSPLQSLINDQVSTMERCERQLGIGLRNKADLGVSAATATLTAAQVNAMGARGAKQIGRGDVIEIEEDDEFPEGFAAG